MSIYIAGLPEKVLADEKLYLKVKNCPNELITIIAEMKDDEDKLFQSNHTYQPASNHEIDLEISMSYKGNDEIIDSNRILWSMVEKKSEKPGYFEKHTDQDINVYLKIQSQDDVLFTTDFKLVFKPEHVERLSLPDMDMLGDLYSPKGEGTFPAVILLNGSDGGCKSNAAAHLASYNFLVYALPYFNSGNLPDNLENIPLEYFKEAADSIKNDERCNGEIHIIGYSKGAELALLLGAVYDDYQSIIACAPGAYVTSGMKGGIFHPVQSWTLNNRPLPYLKTRFSPKIILNACFNYFKKKPMSFLGLWENSIKKSGNLEETRIKAENISCAVMVISGTEDTLWPSSLFTQNIKKYRKHSSDQFLVFEGAGHFISFPYCFINLPVMSHMQAGKASMTFGGDFSSNIHATKRANKYIIDFLLDNSKIN